MEMQYRDLIIPDGDYDAIIVKVNTLDGKNGTLLRFVAKVESSEPEINGVVVSGLADPILARGTRLTKWYEAATGQELTRGMKIELNDMVSKPVLVRVENRENADGDVYPRIVAMARA